jgi:hypothetical protein
MDHDQLGRRLDAASLREAVNAREVVVRALIEAFRSTGKVFWVSGRAAA